MSLFKQAAATFIALITVAALSAGSAAAAELKEGRDYAAINPPQPTEVRGKVEVLEFFSYLCPHCAEFEPTLATWAAKQPKDTVVFKRIPAVFRDNWMPSAKLYYALEAMGEVERLHKSIFEAIHVERVDLSDEAKMTAWLSKKGVDAKKFSAAYNSFGVNSKVQRSKQLQQGHGIDGVPAMTVDGKFRTANSFAGTYEQLLKVVDGLIVQSRAKK